MTGIARGKILPKDLFLGAGEMRLPKSVLLNTVNGQQPDNGPHVGDTDPDMVCRPDAATFRVVPWAAEPVAVVIHDCFEWDGTPGAACRRARCCAACIDLYTKRGWHPVVAPEMEFYLVARQQNPHEPLQPPIGPHRQARSRAAELFDRRGERLRPVLHGAVGVLRCAPARRGNADPRSRRRPDGDQLRAWRTSGAGRPGVPVQAHGARDGAAPRHLRHLHGQADGNRARQRDAHPPEHRRRAAGATSSARPTAAPAPRSSTTSPGCRPMCRR